jgi:glutaminyl-peptide cyclotransferase
VKRYGGDFLLPFALALLPIVMPGCECPPAVFPLEGLAVNGESALALTREFVALGPRPSGSAGARRAAEWILACCREYGCDARIDQWQEDTAHGSTVFRNVIVTIPGGRPGRVLLGSHYDTKLLPHLPDFVGANDSGSSTGLLLEIIRTVSQPEAPWPGPTLECVFFDGEECRQQYAPDDGLHGSRRHARTIEQALQVKQYQCMILLDMVGDRELSVTLPLDSDADLARRVLAAAGRLGVREHFGYYTRASSILDDHKPFQALGIPSIDIIDFEYGPANRYWHTADDTMDKLSADSLAIVGNVVLTLLAGEH